MVSAFYPKRMCYGLLPFCYCICNVVILSCKVQQFPEQQNTVQCDGTDRMKGFADSIIEQIP